MYTLLMEQDMYSRLLLTGLVAAALAVPAAHAQTRPPARDDGATVQMPRPGRVTMIGVRLADVTAENTAALKLTKAEGALVESVNPNSPAATAGLREKDVIVMFDGERVRSAAHLTRLVHETPAGRDVTLSVMRDGRKTDLRIRPEAGGTWFDPRFGDTLDVLMQGVRDNVSGRSRSRLGMNVQELAGDLPAYFGVKSGVLVTAVRPDTPAARAGLKAGDVITAVNGQAVDAARDLLSATPESGSAEEVVLSVVREKKEMTLRASLKP
ncbi:MAG: PDZ domain-containing protein [Acidobacteria bacterium]|nr:MAG: PDZ domain-containing protein [Acidobacteriota bacterium]